MFSVVGLSLDVVGAVALTLGLFGHVRPSTYGGPVRSPDDVAHDAAFAIVGAPLLVSGFAFQALPYFGYSGGTTSKACLLITAALVIAGASALAWIVYGVMYECVRRREEDYTSRARAGGGWAPRPSRFSRLRFRPFWRRR